MFLGFATSVAFFLILLVPLLGLGLAIAAFRSGIDDRPRAIVGGGLLIGTGSVHVLGAVNTFNSCQGQDVCGGARALPFLGFAAAVLVFGLLIEGVALAKHR